MSDNFVCSCCRNCVVHLFLFPQWTEVAVHVGPVCMFPAQQRLLLGLVRSELKYCLPYWIFWSFLWPHALSRVPHASTPSSFYHFSDTLLESVWLLGLSFCEQTGNVSACGFCILWLKFEHVDWAPPTYRALCFCLLKVYNLTSLRELVQECYWKRSGLQRPNRVLSNWWKGEIKTGVLRSTSTQARLHQPQRCAARCEWSADEAELCLTPQRTAELCLLWNLTCYYSSWACRCTDNIFTLIRRKILFEKPKLVSKEKMNIKICFFWTLVFP